MKLLDITQCHEDSPDFRASLTFLEEATNLLEKRLKLIASLCEERRALNEKERAVTQKLIREFDLIGSSDPYLPEIDDMDTAVSSVEVMTTAMRQLLDNQERMFDQINIGIVRPLHQFLAEDLEQVKVSKKAYYKAQSEAHQITEKFGQCKKHELHLMNEISLQLFDARAELHRASCTYALDLNSLHTRKTPDFLNRVVDFMMSQLSFFHLGHVTVKDVEPHITAIYSLVEKLRQECTSRDTKQRSLAQKLMDEVLSTRSQNLLHFYHSDLKSPLESARHTITDHLRKSHSDSLAVERHLDLPAKPAEQPRTKSGYMWYAEPRTFGIHWIRLYFYIKNGMLLSESTSKVKVPISLNLNLCNVKPSEVNDTERNFSFKVTSPQRVLMLQAEGSLEMQEWLDTLNSAIRHAIGNSSRSPPAMDGPTSSSTSSRKGGGANGNGPPGDMDPLPVKPPRRKSNASKDLSTLPGNEVCADCGSLRPKWTSVNLGILICIECSGIHRSLGVYISQVRSLTLDSLKPSVVKHIKSIGNTKSNAIYEARLPKDFERSLVRKTGGEIRQDFITEKYVAMKFATPEDKERILQERQEARAESLRKSGFPEWGKSSTSSLAEVSSSSITRDSSSQPIAETSDFVMVEKEDVAGAGGGEHEQEQAAGTKGDGEEQAGGTKEGGEEQPGGAKEEGDGPPGDKEGGGQSSEGTGKEGGGQSSEGTGTEAGGNGGNHSSLSPSEEQCVTPDADS